MTVEPAETPSADADESPLTARQRIEAGEWVPCKICVDVFRRRRETLRYCHRCSHGFCEGEHGNFSRGVGTCVICGRRQGEYPA